MENGITIIQLINCTPADMIMHKKNTVCTLTTKFTIPKSISTSIKNCVFACVLLSPICVSRLPISIYFGEHLLRENPVSSSALHVCDLVCMFLYIQTETHTLVGVTPFRSFQAYTHMHNANVVLAPIWRGQRMCVSSCVGSFSASRQKSNQL